ncbi:MAG TPA: hypothetical protein VG122_24950 [Gemmata sp.]|jgi:hypothetical protein|nr:hypothetical protein [Gemmata sp.]
MSATFTELPLAALNPDLLPDDTPGSTPRTSLRMTGVPSTETCG